MPYPDRIAVIDPDTPDVEVIFRLLSPGEGPLPPETGVTADGIGFGTNGNPLSIKSGYMGSISGITDTLTGTPELGGVAGLSKTGWGRATYLADPSGTSQNGLSVVWTNGHIITTYGGPIKEPPPGGAPFGIWDFYAAANTELPAFDGGTVTYIPTYDNINVDWGFTSSAFDTDGALPPYFHGASSAPLSTDIRPAAMQFWSFNLPIDPRGISGKMFGLETAYEASTLEINMYILFDFPVDDTLDLPNYSLLGSSFSETDLADNWAYGEISSFDIPDTLTVLTRFDSNRDMYIDIFPDPIELNTAMFNHYNPIIATDAGNIAQANNRYSTRDGWLIEGRVNDTYPWQWYLVSRDWTTYQRMSFVGGEPTFCNSVAAGHTFVYTQDTDGTWLALSANNSTFPATNYRQWVEGAMAPGFTGCTGSLTEIPPLPTIVTGDVIVRAWPLSLDGHDMYVLRLGLTQTLIYDKYSKQWFPWSSFDNAVWAVNTGFEWLGGVGIGATNIVVGDDTTGTLYFLDPEQPYDNPQTVEAPVQQIYFDRIVMGQYPATGREAMPCYAIFVTADMGQPAYDGAAITLYTSDDAGETWDDHGAIEVSGGIYSPELLWTSLGQITAPGRLFMLIDDGALARIDSMEMNDPDDA